ncbi:hypothetical protein SAMN05518866_103162 [Sphingobium sp. YR768]|nr:hypothetical protein SAMN05518866_103162 [Sphingobium sp. YR768]
MGLAQPVPRPAAKDSQNHLNTIATHYQTRYLHSHQENLFDGRVRLQCYSGKRRAGSGT